MSATRKSKIFPHEHWWSRASRVVDRMFRDRELLLRADGRITYLPLTQRFQICLFVMLLTLGLWLAGATTFSIVQGDIIAAKDLGIKEALVAYENLLDEVLAYQKKVVAVTSKLRNNQNYLLGQITGQGVSGDNAPGQSPVSTGRLAGTPKESRPVLQRHLTQLDIEMQQMTETNNLLEGSLNKIKSELAMAEEDRSEIIRTRSKLRDRVRDLKNDLIETRTRETRLKRQTADLTSSLTRARSSHSSLVEERTILERRKAQLEGELSVARSRGDTLQTEVTKLGQDLQGSRGNFASVTRQRTALQSLVSRLATQVQETEQRSAALEVDLGKVIARLESTTGGYGANEFSQPLSDMTLRRQAEVLLERLAGLQSSQENALETLGDRTGGNIKDAERLIAMTGVKLDKLLYFGGGVPTGQGGPFIADDEPYDGPDRLADTVRYVEMRLARWEILTSVLEAMPFTSPVDFYHVASGYGRRRDPITRRRAMHFGADLAGNRKASVFATAPGKIVYAGRKGRFGKMVEIDHGYGLRTRYGHLQRITVKRRQKVSYRQKIGLLGSTGRSTGPHVHYEVLFNGRPIDPIKFIKAGRYVFKGPEITAKRKIKSKRRGKKGGKSG